MMSPRGTLPQNGHRHHLNTVTQIRSCAAASLYWYVTHVFPSPSNISPPSQKAPVATSSSDLLPTSHSMSIVISACGRLQLTSCSSASHAPAALSLAARAMEATGVVPGCAAASAAATSCARRAWRRGSRAGGFRACREARQLPRRRQAHAAAAMAAAGGHLGHHRATRLVTLRPLLGSLRRGEAHQRRPGCHDGSWDS